jgi:hypothetical protein
MAHRQNEKHLNREIGDPSMPGTNLDPAAIEQQPSTNHTTPTAILATRRTLDLFRRF